MAWLLDDEKSLRISLAVSNNYRRATVTDGETDGQTYILRQHSRNYA